LLPALCLLSGCIAQQQNTTLIQKADVTRLVSTLSADDMEGRASFSSGISRAADFISNEFKNIGLEPISGDSYRQTFKVRSIQPSYVEITINGISIPENNVLIFSDQPGLQWNTNPEVKILEIKANENFIQRMRSIREN